MKKTALLPVIGWGLSVLLCSQPNQPLDTTVPTPPAMITMSGPGSMNAPAEIGQKAEEVNQWFVFIARMLQGTEAVEPQINGNIYQWALTLGNGDIRRHIKAVRRSDKSVDWTVHWDGQAEDGTIYNDRTIVIGKAGKNNLSQSWTLFDILTGVETNKMTWQKDGAGNITLSYYFNLIGGEWILLNRPNASGNYEYLLNTIRQFYADWAADGSGSFIDHRSGIVENGNWD